MDNIGNDLRFEMEDFLPLSHPQTSLEHSSLDMACVDAQRSVIPPPSSPALYERLDDSTTFSWAEPHAEFLPETSTLSPAIYTSDSIMPPDHTSAHNYSSFQQNNVSSQNQTVLPASNQCLNQQGPAQISTRKRAPKAQTISAKNWKPHEGRIRELYNS